MTDQEQADVTRPDHPCQTPHAERLAREGVRFTRAFCPTAHCCPSRASLMTGVYPSIHGVYNNISNPTAIRRAPRPGLPMFSEGLREAGYRLVYSGKWHVSDEEGPAERGWEELVVTAGKGAARPRGAAQFAPPAGAAPERARRLQRGGAGAGRRAPPGMGGLPALPHPAGGGAPGVRREAGLAGDQPRPGRPGGADARGRASPGASTSARWAPTTPSTCPSPSSIATTWRRCPLPASYHDRCEDKPRVYQRMRRQYWDQLSEDEIRDAVRHYWAYCTMEDAYLGLFLDALDASGQREDTLVLRLSDHGEYAGAHGLFCKGVPAFREGYHVPCIASWPAGIDRPGREEGAFVTLADIAPTLLEVAGAPVPGGAHRAQPDPLPGGAAAPGVAGRLLQPDERGGAVLHPAGGADG